MRPQILTFVSAYLPGYKAGGPIQSIANLVDHLGDAFDFKVVTRDRDSGDETRYAGVVPGAWADVGKAQVCYLSPKQRTLHSVARLMRETPHDAVYLNSFFHPHFTMLPLLAMRLGLAPRLPVILAPRGEFSGGALALGAFKKRTFLTLTRRVGLFRDVLWQASSEHEERDIRATLGRGARIHVAANLPRKIHGAVPHGAREPGTPLRILFLSRISPMKNLLFVLETLARVSVPVDCTLIGFIDTPQYWEECKARLATLPSFVKVDLEQTVPSSEVPATMGRFDLLFLPTKGENFGHVIIEALGAGTPVLISDRTPWRDLEEQGAGWVYPLASVEPYVAAIEQMYREGAADAVTRRAAALDYARRFSEAETLVGANKALFEAATGGGAS